MWYRFREIWRDLIRANTSEDLQWIKIVCYKLLCKAVRRENPQKVWHKVIVLVSQAAASEECPAMTPTDLWLILRDLLSQPIGFGLMAMDNTHKDRFFTCVAHNICAMGLAIIQKKTNTRRWK